MSFPFKRWAAGMALAWHVAAPVHAQMNASDQAAIEKAVASLRWLETFSCPTLGNPMSVRGMGTDAEIAAHMETSWSFARGAIEGLREPLSRRQSVLRQAKLVHSDRNHDLALLRIEGGPLPPLTLGPPELAPQGSSIALIGFPIGGVFGFTPVVHRGIVAAVSRVALPASDARQLNPATVARLRDGPFEVYQLDATAYPGNSGGPLIDAESGQVIGVVNMVLVRSTRESALTNPTGITYAIPVRRVLDLLKSSGG